MLSNRVQFAFSKRLQHANRDVRPLGSFPHNTNERDYASLGFIASFRKGLPTKDGVVNPQHYLLLVECIRKNDFSALQGIAHGLVDPGSSYFFDDQGLDSACVSLSTAPAKFDSLELALDMEHLYALSLARDIPLTDYSTNSLAMNFANYYHSQGDNWLRTMPTTRQGPLLSQFLLLKTFKVLANKDYMTTYEQYDSAHSGMPIQKNELLTTPRYLSTLRDLSSSFHLDYPGKTEKDALVWLWDNHRSAFINPFQGSAVVPFNCFNMTQYMELLAKACGSALRACWFLKFCTYRMVRPEEFSCSIDRLLTGKDIPYHNQPHPRLLGSPIVKQSFDKYGSYLLSQGDASGCPIHPSYPAGHTAISASCVTILKAFVKPDYILPNPIVASKDGNRLMPYSGVALNILDELDKIVDNTGLGRSVCGVHYTLDNVASLEVGEKVAIRLLEEVKDNMSIHGFSFNLRKFDGSWIQI